MKISLRTKTFILIVIIAVIFGASGVIIGSTFIRRMVDNSYKNNADQLAHTVAEVVDAEKLETLKAELMKVYNSTENKVTSDDWGSPEFNAYMAHFDGMENRADFQSLLEQLRRIQNVNDVDCIYITTIDVPSEGFIYMVDAAVEDPCPPGVLDPIFDENRELLTNPHRGFPPYITNTEAYGWLVTAGAPVYNKDGEVVCYAMVDISMDAIRAQQQRFTLTLSGVLLLLTVIISAVSIFVVNRFIVRPINMLSNTTVHYSAGNENKNEIDKLNIQTGDEIQSLYHSIKKMMHDIDGYIDNLMNTTQELITTRNKADEMDALAHKDALTGVGSKLAYDQKMKELDEDIRQGKARFGIVMVDLNYLKKLNDTYGHEKGNLAIIKTCSIICDVFVHSPVYRIGGDEFVVILKDRDYDNIENLDKKFKQAISETKGEPWEKVSAAIGYALYTDEHSADEVFRKADHIMYENKKKYKQERQS